VHDLSRGQEAGGIDEVRRLWLTGVRKKRTAAQLCLNVQTVRRYVRVAEDRG
jgi:hypothetical protein